MLNIETGGKYQMVLTSLYLHKQKNIACSTIHIISLQLNWFPGTDLVISAVICSSVTIDQWSEATAWLLCSAVSKSLSEILVNSGWAKETTDNRFYFFPQCFFKKETCWPGPEVSKKAFDRPTCLLKVWNSWLMPHYQQSRVCDSFCFRFLKSNISQQKTNLSYQLHYLHHAYKRIY